MSESFTTTFTVERTPAEVFDAINKPRTWWNELGERNATGVGEEFAVTVMRSPADRVRVDRLHAP